MKKNTSYKVRLGIFISLGMAVFIAGIYFIGERQQMFRNTFRISGVFKDVSGLQPGNNVRLSGINVGTVEDISIVSDTSIRVEIIVDENTRKFIKKDAVAGIGSEGLMGNKVIVLNPGYRREKGNREQRYRSDRPTSQHGRHYGVIKTTIDNTSTITSSLSKITNNIQSGRGTIGRLLMDQSMAQNFDSSIVNLKEGSEGLKNLVDSSKNNFAQNFDSIFVNLKEGSAGLKVLADKAKSSWLLWGF